jgi:hypothetical protein
LGTFTWKNAETYFHVLNWVSQKFLKFWKSHVFIQVWPQIRKEHQRLWGYAECGLVFPLFDDFVKKV